MKKCWNWIPNPVRQNAHIDIETLAVTQGEIAIVDMRGTEVANQNINLDPGKHQAWLPVERLSPGAYFVHLTLNGKESRRKFVKILVH